jgi:hypothetical protein
MYVWGGRGTMPLLAIIAIWLYSGFAHAVAERRRHMAIYGYFRGSHHAVVERHSTLHDRGAAGLVSQFVLPRIHPRDVFGAEIK